MGVARHAQRAHADAACHTGARDLDERWPLMPVGNPYTDTKLAAEHAVLAAHAAGELPCTIIRPADVYGPGSRPWVLEPIAAIRGGALVLPARGRGLLTLVYIDDLVDAVVAAGASTAAVGQIFHVGGEAPVTSAEYFAHLFRILGRRGSPRGVPTPVAVALAEGARLAARARGRHTELGRGAMEMLAKSRPVSNAKAHAVLGWWPRVDLVEGMQRVERWLRAEGLV
jgi:nucleoside-diphosphate-sugar epimerase